MTQGLIFWDVDTQVDFISPEGKLYVPGAGKIIPNLKRLTAWAQQNRILVVASADAHREGDPEFAQYPPHCLAGTPGQKKIPATQLARVWTIPNRPAEIPADLEGYDQIVLEKQQFDVFTNPNADALLAGLGQKPEIMLYGVVTEVCVACAARGLQDRDYHLRVVRDAVHHLDEAKGRATLEEIVRRGGGLITTDEVLSRTKVAAR